MSFSFGNKIVTNGLVLYYDAANKSSYLPDNLYWIDITKNANNGELNGGFTFDNSNYGGLVFNGTNYITVSNKISNLFQNSAQALTYAFVLKYTTALTENEVRVIFNVFNTGWSGGRPFILYQPVGGDTSFYAAIYIDEGESIRADTLGARYIPPDTWVYVTFTWDGNTYSIYVNDEEIDYVYQTTSVDSNYLTDSSPIYIGKDGFDFNPQFEGNISTVQIYNRNLTVDEIKQNYNTLKLRLI